MHLNPGSTIGGKYRLGRRLATGGQGSIWIAEHIQLGSHVAIKFMDFAHISSPAALTRFEREAKAAARLRHQNLVHVEDVGVEGGIPYLVMELFEGEDLFKRLKTVGRLSVDETARITNQVARGLRRLHEAGYVHRDLKPGNIFLARSDEGEEVVKILDFGIVKKSGGDLGEGTKTGEFVGSPHYMSPEQIQNVKDIDSRSDLWSLAVVMFRVLTGQLPFPGDGIGAVVANIIGGAVRRPSEIVPTLSPSIDAFFERALTRDPNRRFASAIEMAEAFARAAGVRAPMPSIMDSAMGLELPPSAGPSGPPPAGAESQADAVGLEATTLPRTPMRAAGGTMLIQDPPRPALSDPPAPAYGQPAPPARHTSDPMYHGAPSGGSPSGPPLSATPLSSLKGTQPLNRPDINEAQKNLRTMRMPIAERGGMGQAGGAPSDPPPWGPPSSGPPAGGGAQVDARQAGGGYYARPEQPGSGSSARPEAGSGPPPGSAQPSNPMHAGSGYYSRPEAGSGPPPGSAQPSNPRSSGSGPNAATAPGAGQDALPPWGTPPPSSGLETVVGGLAMHRPGGGRSKGVWVLGGLLLGTGVGVLIALIVILIRS
jgi:serine/threonine-protein kinase